jgi:hypothetical protein
MPVGAPEATTRIAHPPQSWLGLAETRQLPQRDDESAISCGPSHRPAALAWGSRRMPASNAARRPSSEAAARTADAALVGPDPGLVTGISSLSAARAV